jgi:long-chain acyl-CoA synthetase
VGILAAGGADWDRVQLGIVGARGVVVGLDTHASVPQLKAMFAATRPVGLVVDDPAALVRLEPGTLNDLRFVVVLPSGGEADAAPIPAGGPTLTLRALQALGRDDACDPWDLARPDDPAWVIFTSGTTGEPKALVYRHRQVSLAVDAILEAFGDIDEGARLVSWLPLPNPFQRIINLCAVARGAQIYYVADPREVMKHLPRIRPQIFIAVPRFFEKFHAGVTAMLTKGGALQARIVRWALDIGARRATCTRAGRPVPAGLRLAHRVADRLVLQRVRAAFGGELRYLISGSAAMPVWLLERLHAMGLPVLEAYGLSECIVPVASNRVGALQFGSVGQVLKGIELRLAADGELLLRSEGLFEGYLGAAGDVADGRGPDGFMATGDFAEIDGQGFIRLIGRKSEVFKTSTGRRVAPGAVEAVLCSVPGVENAAVFGAGRQSLLAVISVAGSGATNPTAVRASIREALGALPDYQRPAGLVVSGRPFTMEAGELTGNLKLRRKHVGLNYAAALTALAAAVDARVPVSGRTAAGLLPGEVELVLL